MQIEPGVPNGSGKLGEHTKRFIPDKEKIMKCEACRKEFEDLIEDADESGAMFCAGCIKELSKEL